MENKYVLSFLVVFSIFSNVTLSQVTGESDLISANLLIQETKAIMADEMSCSDLYLAKIYLTAYQELYKDNSDKLKNKQTALDLVTDSIESECQYNKGIDGSLKTGNIIITSQGGSINATSVKVPTLYLPTLYMDEASKLKYFASLPQDGQEVLISIEKNKELTDKISELKLNNSMLTIEKINN